MGVVKLGDRLIGAKHPPFVILEAGINHNGQLSKALQMVQLAKKLGADAIKFQTFRAEEFVGDASLKFTYQSEGKAVTESMLEMFKRHELSVSSWRAIKEECDRIGIVFLSTPQNRSDLDVLLDIGIQAIKVGSDDFTNIPLLQDYASEALPMIVSCGMADLAEVHQGLEAIGSLEGHPTILMVCTSQYPTPAADVNLLRLHTLSCTFPELVMGFSDHSQGPLASALAVALGASAFEKHFTLDHNLPGPDHWFSEDPAGAREWVTSIHQSKVMMGSGLVRPTVVEREMRQLVRRSIVALRDIERGEELTSETIGLRRPGTGLPAQFLDQVLGRFATTAIERGRQITYGDFR